MSPEGPDRPGVGGAAAVRPPQRRPYRPPRLVRYGSIVDLTGAQQAGMGFFDGGVVATMGKINFLKSS